MYLLSWLFCNKEEIGCGRKGYCYGTSFCVFTIMTSHTKRCTRKRRFCWSKFEWNPTRSFWVICNLVSLSLIQRQALSLDFACLFKYSLAIGPELFACLSIYENAETCPQSQERQSFDLTRTSGPRVPPPIVRSELGGSWRRLSEKQNTSLKVMYIKRQTKNCHAPQFFFVFALASDKFVCLASKQGFSWVRPTERDFSIRMNLCVATCCSVSRRY